jgi:integrase
VSIETRNTPAGRRYLVRWRENGRQRSRSFTRKGDAETWETEVRRRQQLGPLAVRQLTDRGATLDAWIAERWTPEQGPTLAPSTTETYALVYAKHIRPTLGDVPLRDITVSVLRQWQSARVKDGVGLGALAKARTFLSSVLRHAAESEAIPANPMSVLRAPKRQLKPEATALAPESIERLRSHMTTRDAALVSVMAYAGLRPAEALGLQWKHIGSKTITVNASKTGQRRSVRLLAPLAADLREWKKQTPGVGPGSLVFPNKLGSVWTREAYKSWARPASKAKGKTKRTESRAARSAGAFHRAAIAAGLENVTPYTLRHSFASLLIAEGRNVIYVARQLGHDAKMTLSVYGHVLSEHEESPRIDAAAEIAKARERVLDAH